MQKKNPKEGWLDFLTLCLSLQTVEELNQLFDLFFTIEEKETLSSRFLIIKALLEGKTTQREIAELHKVSIAQITRGSNALKIISDPLNQKLKVHFKIDS